MSRKIPAAILLTAAQYESPWEQLSMWLLRINPVTAEPMRPVADGSWRERLARACDRLDERWLIKWADRYPREPNPRWKR